MDFLPTDNVKQCTTPTRIVQSAAAEQCIEKVNNIVGGDPYLAALRSNLARLQGDADRAFALAKQAVEAESDLVHAHLALLDAANTLKDFQTVAAEMTTLADEFDLDVIQMYMLDEDGAYDDFLDSPEGVQWLKAREITISATRHGSVLLHIMQAAGY